MTLRTTITHLLALRSPLQSALWRVLARVGAPFNAAVARRTARKKIARR
jgi:hypothetical protein